MRRCRAEKARGRNAAYLVFLLFFPHRDSWHLLRVFAEYNITLVVYGGVCLTNAIQELVCGEYKTSLLLEWHGAQYYAPGRPLLYAWDVATAQAGVARLYDSLSSADSSACVLDCERIQRWIDSRSDTFTRRAFDSVHSFRTTTAAASSTPFSSASSTSTDSTPRNAYATSTMSLERARQLLGLNSESECYNAQAVAKAYRRRAMELHPDKQRTDEARQQAHDRFAAVNEARRYLDSLIGD